MGKRSTGQFERQVRDFYVTPPEAVVPLIPHLEPGMTYGEPCVGNGALVTHLQTHGVFCEYASDILPQVSWALWQDVLTITHRPQRWITNPPWRRDILHPLIIHLSDLAPTFLLFDADWAHTKQARTLMRERCVKVVSVGRVKWIADTKHTGKDNCCWFLFSARKTPGPTLFFERC